jgi:hypothetical protein
MIIVYIGIVFIYRIFWCNLAINKPDLRSIFLIDFNQQVVFFIYILHKLEIALFNLIIYY